MKGAFLGSVSGRFGSGLNLSEASCSLGKCVMKIARFSIR